MHSLELKNVTLSDEAKKQIEARMTPGSTAVVLAHHIIEEVVKPLAMLKPTWTFIGTHPQRVSSNMGEDVFNIMAFEVFESGERLGSFQREYARRDYKILVSNDRIDSKRERGRGYCTEDPKKAVARIKKEFGRMSPQERLKKALDAASNYTYHAAHQHSGKVREHGLVVKEAATNYVMGAGFDTFMQHLRENEPRNYDKVAQAKEKYDELKAEMSVLEDIRNKLGSDKSALVVRDFEQYIVRIGDKVALYDDTTLPVAMRGKLGLLKLVEKEHFVSGAGCRVSEEVFVVMLDEESAPDAANTVSEE